MEEVDDLFAQAVALGDTPNSRATAAAMLSRVLELDPERAAAWFQLAARVDTPGERRYCLEQAVRVAPNDFTARVKLAQIKADVLPLRPAVLGGASLNVNASNTTSMSPQASPVVKTTPSAQSAAPPTTPLPLPSNRTPITLALALLGIVVVCGLMVLQACGSRPSATSSQPGTTATGAVLTGQEGYLASGEDKTPVARTEADFDEMMRRSNANDTRWLGEMGLERRVLLIPKNTRVLMLQVGVFRSRVRIIGGDFDGQVMWVSAEFVRSAKQ